MNENKRYFPLKFLIMAMIYLIFGASLFLLLPRIYQQLRSFNAVVFILKSALALKVLNSNFSPSAKCSWIFLILTVPFIAIPIYFTFYHPKSSKKEKRLLEEISRQKPKRDAFYSFLPLHNTDDYSIAREICRAQNTPAYSGCDTKYLGSAKEKKELLLSDIKGAKSFIFLEFYTIATGHFWGEIFAVLREKALHGVEVRIIWDEIGSLTRTPLGFKRMLAKFGIHAVSFRERRGLFIGGMNNRNHRKLAIIDGKISYTGGINIADEYINPKKRIKAWKDVGIRILGDATNELTYIFLSDFSLICGRCESFSKYYRYSEKKSTEYILPFSDGPQPIYTQKNARLAILSLLFYAKRCVTVTTPYLILDSDMVSAICETVRRGVKVRIIIPSIPDRYSAFLLTRSYAERLIRAGVEIYEYTPGFLHAKIYIADEKYAILGSVNLDYRSLWHNFESGVCIFGTDTVAQIAKDVEKILSESAPFRSAARPFLLPKRITQALAEIFAPLF
ncbi:MAG: hypothetical protein J6Q68_00545 [Clostridia bacterium]|nr:hypothetical protein [Clostridia bacterium]